MESKARYFVILGALSAALAVALGAFGAHALADRLSPGMQAIYRTAVLYHLFHAIGLFAVAFVCSLPKANRLACVSGWLMAAGTGLFCGSLYLLSITGIRWLGAPTPLGGIAMIAAWLLLAWAVLHNN
ncbi:MAG: DUF423 domain-containing protein [Desulfobacteraceae bacterium]|nr:MAG: DUF423 domain-containing protein [Desulfobacteraceae bacterium]